MPKVAPSDTKLRGGFYTPPEMTTFLAEWAVTSRTTSVLEPSSGDGAFLDALATRAARLGGSNRLMVTACELDPEEAAKSRARLRAHALDGSVLEGDFFTNVRSGFSGRRFDAVLGNPPFLRFQYFPEASREPAFHLMRQLGLRPNGLTNAWVPFVAVAASLLSPDGRLAMVVPAELLQVTYASQLRQLLADQFGQITLITFRDLVFGGVEQEVVLLLADKSTSSGGIRVLELGGLADLLDPHVLRGASTGLPLDHSDDKWTQYFLSDREFAVARAVLRSNLTRLGAVGSVDVGVVTGNNAFFLLDSDSNRDLGATSGLDRVIHRSAQLRGLSTTEIDWKSASGGKHLLALGEDDVLAGAVKQYLDLGVSQGVPLGYKCRIRRKWWVVPSRHQPDAFMLRQIHSAPRLSLNEAAATSTDTVHRVRFGVGVDARSIVLGFHSSLTFALAEMLGRSYGGGVLELEPTEAERLPIAPISPETGSWASIDAHLRQGEIAEAALATDTQVMRETDLTRDDMLVLHGAWERLRNRRMKRGQSSRNVAPLAETA